MITFLYKTAAGRALIIAMQKLGVFRLGEAFLSSGLSKPLIKPFIRRNNIDTSGFEGVSFSSFGEFFSRKKETIIVDSRSSVLISPCDSMLSVYPITEDMCLPIKDSLYRLQDIIPDASSSGLFRGGLCLVFRLRATDYHHFCAFDDLRPAAPNYIPGLLHSVQPVACDRVPVYKLNRRWWSLLETEHFGTAAQIEVGAMQVGDVRLEGIGERLPRGAEMGCFLLSGSTVILLLGKTARENLRLFPRIANFVGSGTEAEVHIGEAIGELKK